MATAYITSPPEDAERLASELVEERLAACVNRVPCRSTYWWDGSVQTDEEEILLVKTTDERYPEIVEHVERSHPHEVPCIERFDEGHVLQSFADWRRSETIE